MGNPIKHADSNNGNVPAISGVALSGFRAIDALHGYEPGTFVFDDFHDFAPTSAEQAAAYDGEINGYYFLQDAGCLLKRAALLDGVVHFATDGTDDDFFQMATGGGLAGFCQIPTATASRKRLFFEARLKIEDVSEISAYVGLKHPTAGVAATAQVVLDADNTLGSNQQLIGFHLKTNDDLMTHVQEGSTATTNSTASVGTLTDNTWHKLTVMFDEGPADSGTIKFAIDGTVVQTYNDVDTTLGTSLPDGVPLLGICAFKAEAGTVENVWIDYIAYGYEGTA
jgi:hypothetical protein